MSLIKIRAKVKVSSESFMEAEEAYDMGKVARSASWEWRNMCISYKEIYKIIEFTDSKSIIILYDTGERILVAESFDSLTVRWQDLINLYGTSDKQNNQESETTSEEEDD